MSKFKQALADLLPSALTMRLKAADHYLNGEPELRLLGRIVDPRRQAVDAGANIGVYSYFLTRHAREVYAYEPNPELADNLRRALPEVKVRQVALSDRPQELVFSVPVDESGRQSHELGSVAQDFSGPVRQFPVTCVTIDSEGLQDVGFIKIDVEQHERQVLRGALATIDRCRPVILIEVYPLKYTQPVPAEFAFILDRRYCGWFAMGEQWLPLERFDPALHAAAEHFGQPGRFMGNNLVLFPDDHPLAKLGPAAP